MLLRGAIQHANEKYDNAVNRKPIRDDPLSSVPLILHRIRHLPGRKYHANAAPPVIMRNLNRVIPPWKLSSSACKVLRLVATTRIPGQIIDAGQMTNRRHSPANENPVIWQERV